LLNLTSHPLLHRSATARSDRFKSEFLNMCAGMGGRCELMRMYPADTGDSVFPFGRYTFSDPGLRLFSMFALSASRMIVFVAPVSAMAVLDSCFVVDGEMQEIVINLLSFSRITPPHQ
jgi:hypothetical protein